MCLAVPGKVLECSSEEAVVDHRPDQDDPSRIRATMGEEHIDPAHEIPGHPADQALAGERELDPDIEAEVVVLPAGAEGPGVVVGGAERMLPALAVTDLIHDETPVLGFLDDAIMIDLVARELRHEIRGYRDFHRYRTQLSRRPRSPGPRLPLETLLDRKRKQIRARIQAKQAQEAARTPERRRFRLW